MMTQEQAVNEMVKTIRRLQRNGFTVPPTIWIFNPRNNQSERIDTATCRDEIDRNE